jgi:hypothetical protein
MTEIKKTTRGGKRENSGRKRKYGEPTKVITIRVPLSEVEYVKKMVKKYLNSI